MIHPTAIIGARPFFYERHADGRRTAKPPATMGVELGHDVDVFPFAIIVNGTERVTTVGTGTKVSHRAQIGHDSTIGADTVIGIGAVVCGFAEIGDRCTLGAGAIVCPEVKVGDDCFVGAGVVVYIDLPPNTKITQAGIRRNWENLPWRGE